MGFLHTNRNHVREAHLEPSLSLGRQVKAAWITASGAWDKGCSNHSRSENTERGRWNPQAGKMVLDLPPHIYFL